MGSMVIERGLGAMAIEPWAVLDFNDRLFWTRTSRTENIFHAALFEGNDKGLLEAREWADKFVRGQYKNEKDFMSRVIFVKVNVHYFCDFQTMEAPLPKARKGRKTGNRKEKNERE